MATKSRASRVIGLLGLAVCTAFATAQNGDAGAPLVGIADAATDAGVPDLASLSLLANNAWVLLCAALVFVMHLGFSVLESGLTRA